MTLPDLLLSAIERKGWRAARPDAERDLFLSFTPSWTCLHTRMDGDPGEPGAAHRCLLLRNEEMFMAKFGLDHAGILTLQAELPNANALRLIDYALVALLRYAEQNGESGADRVSKELYFDEPPGLPPEVVAYYIRAVEPRGWFARSKPKGITWPLVYKGQRTFEVYLTVTKAWTYFHIPALPEETAAITDVAVQRAFWDYLLNVNTILHLAKLGLGERDQVLLMLDLPTQELDFEMFRLATRLLATYIDLYAREVQIMSRLESDPRLLERLVQSS